MHQPAEELVLDGVKYIRADLVEGRTRERHERWHSVAELVRMSGFSRSSIYRAMDEGRLEYRCPNESGVGRRVSDSMWTRFLAEI